MLSADRIKEIKAQAFVGVPSQLSDVCKIYPLKMKEIIEMGELTYNSKLGLLLLNETQIIDIIKEKTGEELSVDQVNPLLYLLASTEYNDGFLLDLQKAFYTFIKEEVLFLPKINSILVGAPEERRLITVDNFQDFQNILKIQNCKEVTSEIPKDETPWERKMRINREKVAQAKRRQANKNGKTQTLLERLEIAAVYGIDYRNETFYGMNQLIRRHQAKEKWDMDMAMLCAGADSKKIKTKYWGENLDDE